MSIRFGWTRAHLSSPMTDHGDVDEPARAPGSGERGNEVAHDAAGHERSDGALDALRTMTSRAIDPAAAALVRDVHRLHASTVAAERRAHRFLAGSGARRDYHSALVAEADALRQLGYETFDVFEQQHPSAPPSGAPVDDETMARIRRLLDELGVDAGDDPLVTAKIFLDGLESARDRLAGTALETAPAEEGDEDERVHDRAAARAERWFAELEHVRDELAGATTAREAAERDAADARDQLIDLRQRLDAATEELERAHLASVELDATTARLAELETTLAGASSEREQIDAQLTGALDHVRELEEIRVQLGARVADLEQLAENRSDALAAAEDRVNGLVERLQDLETNRTKLEVAVAEHEAALARAAERQAALERDLAECVGDRDDARAQAARLEARLLERDAELAAEENATTERLEEALRTITTLEAALATEVSAHEAARLELDVAHARGSELADTLATLQTERDELRAEVELVRMELARLEATSSAHDDERRELVDAATVAQERAADLGDQLDGARATLDALAAHAAEVEEELALARTATTSNAAAADELLAQARTDADALRRQAMEEAEAIRRDAMVTAAGIRQIAEEDARQVAARVADSALANAVPNERFTDVLDRIAKLERRIAKQRKRLERAASRIEEAESGKHASRAASEIVAAAKQKASERLEAAEELARQHRDAAERDAAELRAQAQRDAAAIRADAEQYAADARASAERERQIAREELAALLERLGGNARDAP